jgi:hypothetical protein
MSEANEPIRGVGRENEQGLCESYVPPRLVSLGNLHDLLAGTTGTDCDGIGVTGFTDPKSECR